MTLVRAAARPMLSAIFIVGGLRQLREPDGYKKQAEPVTDLVARSVPRLPRDTETLVRINGATQVGAGVLFALGKFPRLSALVMAGSLVPTTAAGHRFWEETDPGTRAGQQSQFLKNAGICGGLLFAAVAGRGRRRRSGKLASSRGAGNRGKHRS